LSAARVDAQEPVDRRERFPVRAHPLVFGVVIFLASEAMFFAALFASYYDLRNEAIAAGAWPPPGVRLDVLDSSIGTSLLFLSSLFTVLMTRALDRKRSKAAHAWLIGAIVCGAAFIAIGIAGYAKNTFTVASNAYGSLFYTLTGFHLLHVAAGVLLLAGLYFGLQGPAMRANHRAGAEAIMYYWHFVFVVWLGVWATIYLIR
jgi:cytochrome c oxidase subunit 3